MSEYRRGPLRPQANRRRIRAAGGAITALLLALAGPLLAHSYTLGSLSIGHPWARETAKGQAAGGAFLTIANKGNQADRLVSASSPVAREVQIHAMSMDGGVMRMRPLRQGLPIPAGKTVKLEPGGYHMMLTGLKQPLERGTRVPLTLHFQRAGTLQVELAVHQITWAPSAEGHHHE